MIFKENSKGRHTRLAEYVPSQFPLIMHSIGRNIAEKCDGEEGSNRELVTGKIILTALPSPATGFKEIYSATHFSISIIISCSEFFYKLETSPVLVESLVDL
jgi:hypothetical protein